MIKSFISIFFLLSLLPRALFSQCTDPMPPVLTSVSVDPATGQINIKWEPSPSAGIAAYIIYWRPDENAGWIPVETLWDPSARSYIFTTTATKYSSVPFVAAAYRLPAGGGTDGCRSVLSNSISTIFCTAVADSCRSSISIRWNRYEDFSQEVTQYKLFSSENGSTLSEKHSISKDSTSYTLNDFTRNIQYCFTIKAFLEDGTWSESNLSECLLVKMQRPPAWINADYATVNDQNKTELSFTIDPLAEISRYALERRTLPDEDFKQIAQTNSQNGSIFFADNEADTGKVSVYRLSALNGCDRPVAWSNICSNMVLSLKQPDDDIILSWNRYRQWRGQVSSYEVYMNSGIGYVSFETTTDSMLRVKMKDIMYGISAGRVCFYVKASESNNPSGINNTSRSAYACTSPAEIITVPNIFTPNNDSRNDFFKPVLSFTPSEYRLIISDRNGTIMFETTDSMEEWDGSDRGNTLRNGVFLWSLRLTTPSGKRISKTGTLTVIR